MLLYLLLLQTPVEEVSEQRRLELLKEYMAQNDNMVPMQKSEWGPYQGVDLGKWCCRIRDRRRKGELTQEQVEEFEAIQGWWWKVREMMCICHRRQNEGHDQVEKCVTLNWLASYSS